MATHHFSLLAQSQSLPRENLRSRSPKNQQPLNQTPGESGTGQKSLQKQCEQKLKNLLPDYLRGELSDPAHGTTAHARMRLGKLQRWQPRRSHRVRCSAWLGHVIVNTNS